RSLDELLAEADRSLADLAALGERVETRIAALEALQGGGVSRLAKVYAAMAPEHAARLRGELDAEVATARGGHMKEKQSAAVLAAMTPEAAVRVTRHAVLPVPAAVAAPPGAASPPADAAAAAPG